MSDAPQSGHIRSLPVALRQESAKVWKESSNLRQVSLFVVGFPLLVPLSCVASPSPSHLLYVSNPTSWYPDHRDDPKVPLGSHVREFDLSLTISARLLTQEPLQYSLSDTVYGRGVSNRIVVLD